jgi:hypothetical protein
MVGLDNGHPYCITHKIEMRQVVSSHPWVVWCVTPCVSSISQEGHDMPRETDPGEGPGEACLPTYLLHLVVTPDS